MGAYPFPTGGQAYSHNGDFDLMQSLGLKTNFDREWTDVGTVTVEEARDNEYGPDSIPAATVKVEVSAMPAQFFRFTVNTTENVIDEEPYGDFHFTSRYEPRRYVLKTGSGSFTEYWAVAKMMAQNMLTVEQEAP